MFRPMRQQLLRVPGIFVGPLAVVVDPCMYIGGRISGGPVHGETQVGISPSGIIMLLIAARLFAGFRVLGEEGLMRPFLRAAFGNWR